MAVHLGVTTTLHKPLVTTAGSDAGNLRTYLKRKSVL